jgi:hypothetical protein
MSTVLVPGASIELPLSGRRLNAAGIAADAALARLLRAAVEALVSTVLEYRQVQASLALPNATARAGPVDPAA